MKTYRCLNCGKEFETYQKGAKHRQDEKRCREAIILNTKDQKKIGEYL